MNPLLEWAADWNVSPQAVADLARRLTPAVADAGFTGEAAVQAAVRREAAEKNALLMRNNVGVLMDARGRPVRYGLANDSKTVNNRVKSGDLIGLRALPITQEMVGSVVGQFISRECKAPGWKLRPGDERGRAQLNWAILICAMGGDAAIATGVGTL